MIANELRSPRHYRNQLLSRNSTLDVAPQSKRSIDNDSQYDSCSFVNSLNNGLSSFLGADKIRNKATVSSETSSLLSGSTQLWQYDKTSNFSLLENSHVMTDYGPRDFSSGWLGLSEKNYWSPEMQAVTSTIVCSKEDGLPTSVDTTSCHQLNDVFKSTPSLSDKLMPSLEVPHKTSSGEEGLSFQTRSVFNQTSSFRERMNSYQAIRSNDVVKSCLQVILAELTAENMRLEVEWWKTRSFSYQMFSTSVSDFEASTYNDYDRNWGNGIVIKTNPHHHLRNSLCNQDKNSKLKISGTNPFNQTSSNSDVKARTANDVMESLLQVRFAEQTASEMMQIVGWWKFNAIPKEVLPKSTAECTLAETDRNDSLKDDDDKIPQSHCFPENSLLIFNTDYVSDLDRTDLSYTLSYPYIDSSVIECHTGPTASSFTHVTETLSMGDHNTDKIVDQIMAQSDSYVSFDEIPSMKASDVSGTRMLDQSGNLLTLDNSCNSQNTISEHSLGINANDRSMVDDSIRNWKSGTMNSFERVKFSEDDDTCTSVVERHAFVLQELEKVNFICTQTLSWADQVKQIVANHNYGDPPLKNRSYSALNHNISHNNPLRQLKDLNYFGRVTVKIYLTIMQIGHHLSRFDPTRRHISHCVLITTCFGLFCVSELHRTITWNSLALTRLSVTGTHLYGYLSNTSILGSNILGYNTRNPTQAHNVELFQNSSSLLIMELLFASITSTDLVAQQFCQAESLPSLPDFENTSFKHSSKQPSSTLFHVFEARRCVKVEGG